MGGIAVAGYRTAAADALGGMRVGSTSSVLHHGRGVHSAAWSVGSPRQNPAVWARGEVRWPARTDTAVRGVGLLALGVATWEPIEMTSGCSDVTVSMPRGTSTRCWRKVRCRCATSAGREPLRAIWTCMRRERQLWDLARWRVLGVG